MALTTPPVMRPYSAGRPVVSVCVSEMNSTLTDLTLTPVFTPVALRPSMMYSFSAPEDPYTVAPRASEFTPGASCAAAVKLRATGRVCRVAAVTFTPPAAEVTSTTGAALVTVICSLTCGLIATSRVTVRFRPTWTLLCLTTLKPDSVAERLYTPGGRSVKRNCPFVSVTSVRVPCRAGDLSSRVTPGSGVPA